MWHGFPGCIGESPTLRYLCNRRGDGASKRTPTCQAWYVRPFSSVAAPKSPARAWLGRVTRRCLWRNVRAALPITADAMVVVPVPTTAANTAIMGGSHRGSDSDPR